MGALADWRRLGWSFNGISGLRKDAVEIPLYRAQRRASRVAVLLVRPSPGAFQTNVTDEAMGRFDSPAWCGPW